MRTLPLSIWGKSWAGNTLGWPPERTASPCPAVPGGERRKERAEEVLSHALHPCQKVYRKESPLRRPTPTDSPVLGCFCSTRAVIYSWRGVNGVNEHLSPLPGTGRGHRLPVAAGVPLERLMWLL